MERLESSRDFAVGNGLAPAPPDPFAVAAPTLSELDPLAGIDGMNHRAANALTRSGAFQRPAISGQAFSDTRSAAEQIQSLKVENEELHKLVEEMKQIFAQASEQEVENSKVIDGLRNQITELERTSAHKDEQLDLLQVQLRELEQHIQEAAPPPPPPSEDELSKMADELEKERCQLAQDRKVIDTDRQQLREDEEDMTRQMREMEVQMARERAEIARQRTELQRLHGEVKHELEQMGRNDRALTDRLAQFQRRHTEMLGRAGIPQAVPAATVVATAPEPAADPKKDGGLIGRLFGRK
jgi:chromosome segregation ATPase